MKIEDFKKAITSEDKNALLDCIEAYQKLLNENEEKNNKLAEMTTANNKLIEENNKLFMRMTNVVDLQENKELEEKETKIAEQNEETISNLLNEWGV